MMESCDVLVLGLGPAGANAAAEAARRGARVIALDRKREAGVPVQCAELVPGLLEVDPRTVCQRVDAMLTFVEDDAPDVKGDFPGRMIDRAAFDAALVALARAAGADCRFSAFVKRISREGTVELSDGRRLSGQIIIGADGPKSLAGKAIGQVNAEIVETRQVTVPLRARHTATDIFLSADIPGGYGWLFPKADVANVGAGVSPFSRGKLKSIVQSLHGRLVEEGRVGSGVLAMTGGAIPVGGMLEPVGRLGDTLVILAGDAAGLANPVTGAGIAAAVHSGRMAGSCAANCVDVGEKGAKAYREELEDLFAAALERARRRRRELVLTRPDKDALRRGWIAYPEYWR